MVKKEDAGVVGGVNVGLPILMTMSAFLAIALYNVIETSFLILASFKQRKGLYFWSLVIANWGIAPHAIGFILKFFQVTNLDMLSSIIVGIGWICMVIGQSVVLYSRLHLVVHDVARIRWVLYMIIFTGIVIGCPLLVLAMGSQSIHSARFLPGFMIYDRVQLVVISVQEGIISIIYIYETVRLLGQGDIRRKAPLKKLLLHLIVVNIVVLLFDISLLAVQFSGMYMIQTTYKTAVYSIKLKIEFSVLNRLVNIIKHKDLLSMQHNAGTNNISLSDWSGSKKTQFSTNPGGPGTFVKMNDLDSVEEKSRNISVGASEISIDETGTVSMQHDALYSEANGRPILSHPSHPASAHMRSHSVDVEKGR
ncbi:hypothetical protein B0J11DRAFT_445735 [Dendryphion nanum]|uniref:DUF7703 domain-containing protein n=1 Tax=Dendryphion nanum TaxID=256645 RepID=A0A9P9IBD2_9PLEO|nr:hypothetical protein B0J11DRAFT_445735 [Dendryphion nanum]